MSITTHTAMPDGLTPRHVEVEIETVTGLPNFVLIGLASQAVDEAKERITAALLSCGIPLKAKRTVVNLAPAELKKNSSCLELAIAVGLLRLYKALHTPSSKLPFFPEKTLFIGELALDGSLRPVRGALPITLAAADWGYTAVVVPSENLAELKLVSSVQIYPLDHLSQLLAAESGAEALTVLQPSPFATTTSRTKQNPLSHIAGQERAKRALVIAAAGGHNLHLVGPPGAGKSLLAQSITQLLPPLSEEEVLELTALHSLAGLTLTGGLIVERPFIAPHHSSSRVGLLGGGTPITPGALSLAHRGVLFLDEFPEFPRSIIESLRQPLEQKTLTVTRAQGSIIFPADFTLITAANPCPCGFWGSEQRICTCNEHIRLRYQNKLSGPIMDRIDMTVWVDATDVAELSQLQMATPQALTHDLIESIRKVREIKRARQVEASHTTTQNSVATALDTQHILKSTQLTKKAQALAIQQSQKLQLSARKYLKLLKVARTIADLQGSDETGKAAIQEALGYIHTVARH